jgi:arylsulfatase A-like enzyme
MQSTSLLPDERVARWAAAFLQREHDVRANASATHTNIGTARIRPFFLTVGFMHPHAPTSAIKSEYKGIKQYVSSSSLPSEHQERADWMRLPVEAQKLTLQIDGSTEDSGEPNSMTSLHGRIRGYYSALANVDENLGIVIAALDASKRLSVSTIVVATSDHGNHLGHKLRTRRPHANTRSQPSEALF